MRRGDVPRGRQTGRSTREIRYQGTIAPEDSAFGLAFNTRDPVCKWLEQYPDRQARFFGATEGVCKDYGHSLEHVANGYPWVELGDATVVDVKALL